jgi:hypothetical protein
MTTATHARVSPTHRSAWTDRLARMVVVARQRAAAWWNPEHMAPHSGAGSATAEANRVRNLAMGYMRHDPRFAADLFAAADRHEEQHAR